jgi:hypothetical protein
LHAALKLKLKIFSFSNIIPIATQKTLKYLPGFQLPDHHPTSKEKVGNGKTDQSVGRANAGESHRDGQRAGEQVDARVGQADDGSFL